jgi:L-rhamnonate dehydratase
MCEYVAASPDGRSILPIFGKLFTGEALPQNGKLKLGDAPGFGMEIADRTLLTPFE